MILPCQGECGSRWGNLRCELEWEEEEEEEEEEEAEEVKEKK